MSHRRRQLTFAEHQRLGELLYQAQQCLWEAYTLAAQAYTVADLKKLERLMRSGSAIDQVKNQLDNHFWNEVHDTFLPEPTKGAQVYYGVQERCTAWNTSHPMAREEGQ